MSKRGKWLAAAVAALSVCALAACSSSSKSPTTSAPNTPPATAGSAATSAPATSGTSGSAGAAITDFVVARTGDIDKTDPLLATAFQTVQTLGLVYSRLVTTDGDGHIVPDLASKWDVSADGKTITFTLRTDVKWQADGSAFTSADVKATIARILDEKTAAVGRSNLAMISSVDTPDDATVVLNLTAPSAALFYALSSVSASIESAKDIAAGTIGKADPNGTGPYSWKSWTQNQSVVLTSNPDYYGGAPAIQTLEFRVIPDESSILSGMQAGAFQLGILSDPGVAKQASGNGFQLVKQPALSYHALMLNGRRAPLTNEKVRVAIACAIDRNEVLTTAAYGDGEVTGPITSPAYQYDPTDGLGCTPGDTAAAKQMLADAGYAKGFTLKTIVETGEYATAVAEATSLKSQLAKIGVNLSIQQMPTSPYVTAWLAADYDAAVALNGGSYDPYLMYGRYFTTGGSLSVPAGLDSTKLSDLLNQGNATTDETQRQTIFGNLQKELLAESPWIWMFRSDDYYLVSNSIQGFVPRPDEALFTLANVSGA